jgi:Flp pilus assembly protein TadD
MQMRKVVAAAGAGELTNSATRFLKLVNAADTGSNAVATLPMAEETLAENPKHLPALMVKAVALAEQKQHSEAVKLYERMMQLWPLFAPAARNLALLYFEHLNEPGKAFALGLKVRGEFPEDARLAKALGVLAFRSNDFDRAAHFLNVPASTDPEDSETAGYLGMSYFRLGQSARAKSYLAQAAADTSLDPKLRKEAKATLEQIR